MIILIDQKEYAVGLSWFAIGSTHELEQFEREMELHHGVLKMSKDEMEQSTVALCGPEYNNQVSLAGMLSFAYANLIYVLATEYKDDNGQPLFYLCAVKNHAVTVDGDMVGTRETIVSLYSQNYAEIMADVDPNSVNCFGTGIDDALFPGINIVETHHVLDQALRYAAQATIKPLGKKELSKGSLALIVGLVIIGGYLIYTFFLKPPPPPPPPPPQAVAAPPPPPPPDPHKMFMETFAQTLLKQPRVSILAPVLNAVGSLPLAYDGWTIKTITFQGASPEILMLELDRSPYANVEQLMLLHDKGVFSSLHVDLAGQHAMAGYAIKPGAVIYIDANTISSLPNEGSPKLFDMMGKLQEHNIPVEASELEKNDYFAETKINFKGEGIWSMVALYNVLLPYDTLALKSVVIKIDNGKYNWTIEGVIYG